MKRLFIIMLLLTPLYSGAQIITTIAGGGPGGDGSPAITASVYDPVGIAIDQFGNIYISEALGNKVRKIDATGIITTVAGTGTAGYNGDGILAVDAQLYQPCGIAVDSIGNLFIADASNNRVRKVNVSTGIITTICGNGTTGFSGDSGLATGAAFYAPGDVKFDRLGNLYISSDLGARVREINTSGIINTIAGTGAYGDSGDGGLATAAKIQPSNICLDTFGNIYLTDVGNNVVRKIDATTGIITRIAGDSSFYTYNGDDISCLSAHIDPEGIVIGPNGLLYIGDRINNSVRMIDSFGIIHTVAGDGSPGTTGDSGPATSAEVYWPSPVAFDQCGNMYIGQIDDPHIRKVTFNTSGTPSITIVTPVDTVCAGTAVTFTTSVSGITTFAYKWVVNGAVVATTGSSYTYTPANGDSIRCILAGTGDCSGAADTVSSNTIHMVVNAPVVPVITLSGTSFAITGSAVTLTASITPVAVATGSYTIKWYNNGTLFSTTTSTITTCTVTTGANNITAAIVPAIACTDSAATAAAFIIKASPEDISTVTAQQQVSIYPNPAHNEITVTGNGLSIITISNTIGQIVQTRKAAATQERIDISSLPSGIYFVTVTGTDGRREVSKIIKQ